MTRMDPSDMLLTFLPILIFESSFGMDAHMFYKALPQCLILAVVGFSFCTVLTAVFAKFALQIYDWSWLTALAFGSVVSATDPVAVVALLREMKMPHSFTVLIEGESLLNDGVAIVMYEMLSHIMESERDFVFGITAIELLKTCIGAPTLGYILGKMTEWILIRIYISPVSEMTITIVMAYVTYFVAERFLGISAVLAVVLYGVTLNANKMCISPESESLVHTDWRLLSIYANTLIFMIVGILVTVSFSEHITEIDVGFILVTYIALTFLRSVMIAIFYPVLKRTGYGLNWKESIILSWGGLRGAIGLALSLMLASNPRIPRSANANKVLVQVSGIIVLTLIVNANSVKYIMKLIKFKEITLVKRLSMGNTIACVTEIKEKSVRICKDDWKLMKADWGWVIRKTKLEDPYEGGLHGEDPNMYSLFVPYGTCNECMAIILPYAPNDEEMDELKEAARKKVLRALKGNLWRQFRKGLLQRRSLKLLCVAADDATDIPNLYLKTDEVKRNFMKISRHNHWLETKLYQMKKLRRKRTDTDLEIYHLQKSNFEGFRSFCASVYFSVWFEPLIFGVIILNVIYIAMDLYFLISGSNKYKIIMDYFAVFFILFYKWEIIVKITALKWSLYKKCFWNRMDLSFSVLAILEGTLDLILVQFPSLHTIATHIRILIVLRIFKYFHAVAMLDVLDEFEKQYPAVVLALKSNRAARRILNRVKVVLDRLKKKSLILEEDASEMKSILFKMTKQVVYAPRARPFIENVQKILEEVDWINSNLAKDIFANHTIVSYDAGEVIQEEGIIHQYVFIIAKGIVKVIGEKKEQGPQIYNKLPNADSVLFFHEFKAYFHDYLTTSQTIGLLGFLQKSPSVTTVICEKDCELIQIDYSFLNEAQNKFDDLIFCMWRSIAIKISFELLKKERRYKTYTDEDIHLCLQKAVLLDLMEITSWNVPSVVQDMIVIQGRIKNVITQLEYVAPSYIPRTSRYLQLLDDIKKRPRVVILLLLDQKFSFHSCADWITQEEINDACCLHPISKQKKQQKS